MGTISKALDLLNFFAHDRPEIGLSEFVRRSKRDKATVHRHLTELAENGFLEQNPESRAYRLGPALLRLSALRETQFPLRKLLQPIVTELSEVVGELAHASLLQAEAMSPLFHADPCLHGVQVHFDIAEMLPFHATSSGLAALAFCAEEVQQSTLARPLSKHTEWTIDDPGKIQGLLAETRKHGLATLTGAFDNGVSSVGAPIFGEDQRVVGALAVAIPTVRVTGSSTLRTIGKQVLAQAERASIALGGTFPTTLTDLPENWGAPALSPTQISGINA